MKPKPAFFAVNTLTTELDGYSFANRMSVTSHDDYLLLFKKGDSIRMAAWTAGEPHSISLPIDVEQVEIVSRSGERTKANVTPRHPEDAPTCHPELVSGSKTDGKLELKLTNSPQYVEPAGRSTRWAIEAAWNVEAGTVLTDSGLQVKVKSIVNGYLFPNTTVEVSGNGLERASMSLKTDVPGTQEPVVLPDAHSENNFATRYEYTGESRPLVTITLLPDGMTEPIVRVVELDKSACPIIDVLPSTGKEVQVAVRRPVAGRMADSPPSSCWATRRAFGWSAMRRRSISRRAKTRP